MPSLHTPLPVTLLTGFLGSGKTTLLNNLLKPSFWERLLRVPPLTAVIINEFGSVGLDHQLVSNANGAMALLSGGCVCCEIQGSLVPTLKNLWMARQSGTVPPYERIIIETTGIADPTTVMETLLRVDWLAKRHYLDGVVTTVDAMFGAGQLDEHFEAVRQVAVADRLLLTKTDLATPSQIANIEQRLRTLNPTAPIKTVLNGITHPDDVFGLRAYHQAEAVASQRWLGLESLRILPPATTPHTHGSDGRIRSFSLSFDAPIAWQNLSDALESIAGLCNHRLLRMKGIINVQGNPYPVVVHGVQHLFYPTVQLPAWPDTDRRSHFVFITADLDESFVNRILNEFLWRTA